MVKFCVITFNLDENEFNRENRLKRFFKIIEDNNPDVVTIQEGTHLIYEKLFREMGCLGYKRNVPSEVTMRNTGEVIFSKLPILTSEYIYFQTTSQSRGLSRYLIEIEENLNVWVATTQFEKGERSLPQRRAQIQSLGTAFQFLKDPIIFAGDTGILEYQKELCEPEKWDDAWYDCGDENNKYTVNYEQNIMVKPPNKDRTDRIWFCSSANILVECIEFDLVGNTEDTLISTHFGVKATFDITLKK